MGDETVVPPTQVAPAPEAPNTPPAPATPSPKAEFDLAKVLEHPLVRAEISKQATAAATRAAQEATTAAAEEARKAAERAQMDEANRARAEKADAEEAARRAKEEARLVTFDRDLYATLLQGGHQLASAEALDFLKYHANKMVENKEVQTAADAIAATIAKHTYLVKANTPPPPPVPPVAETPPPARPNAAAAPPKDTVAAGGNNPAPQAKPDVDVLSMTKAEYAKYKRDVLGIQ